MAARLLVLPVLACIASCCGAHGGGGGAKPVPITGELMALASAAFVSQQLTNATARRALGARPLVPLQVLKAAGVDASAPPAAGPTVYHMDVLAYEADCRRASIDSCHVLIGGRDFICSLTIWTTADKKRRRAGDEAAVHKCSPFLGKVVELGNRQPPRITFTGWRAAVAKKAPQPPAAAVVVRPNMPLNESADRMGDGAAGSGGVAPRETAFGATPLRYLLATVFLHFALAFFHTVHCPVQL